MRLEDVTAEIRPRAPWESIDLGCSLARKHLGKIWKAWAMTVFPLWLALAILLRDHPVWLFVSVWWLKPLYDRVPLMVVSRALFGAAPTFMEVLKAWPKMLVRRFFFALFLGRFSPARNLNLPVTELEGLRGADYRQRVNLLERNGGEGATMATLAGMMLEWVTGIGLVMLAVMLVPGHVSAQWWEGISEFFVYDSLTEFPAGFFWLVVVVYMLAITIMEPFYVSAGFALYVNSRTLTEGWDIELAFKRLGGRLTQLKSGTGSKGAALLLVGMLGLLGLPYADASDVNYRESAQEVMADEDFTIHHRNVEEPVEKSSSGDNSFLEWLGDLFGAAGVPGFMGVVGIIIFWIVTALVIAGIVYLIVKNKHVFRGGGGRRVGVATPKIEAVMGMDIRPESLPDDVVSAARQAWSDGNGHLALSLLYRGAITWFVYRGELPIEESDTEGDCLRRVQATKNSEYGSYFSGLTETWIHTAYGKNEPDGQRVMGLCDSWPFGKMAPGGKGGKTI